MKPKNDQSPELRNIVTVIIAMLILLIGICIGEAIAILVSPK